MSLSSLLMCMLKSPITRTYLSDARVSVNQSVNSSMNMLPVTGLPYPSLNIACIRPTQPPSSKWVLLSKEEKLWRLCLILAHASPPGLALLMPVTPTPTNIPHSLSA